MYIWINGFLEKKENGFEIWGSMFICFIFWWLYWVVICFMLCEKGKIIDSMFMSEVLKK